ncbi:hypothetical protein BGZ95_004248 [Linnemannia exigua]|uniref:BTB domain-containing protein n=1 Tax=Linnemannia exigua TaxID=604196 RepID=A0AAD4DJR6_9FUNG|nr:hypothetical protein BGZ95_004248 [Linnemannia exigua]
MTASSPIPHKELTLKVEVPIINKHSITMISVQDEDSSITWYVELDRGATDMKVSVMRNTLDPTIYCAISIIPCNASQTREWTALDNNRTRYRSSYPVHEESAARLITNEDNFEFEIVLSTKPVSPRSNSPFSMPLNNTANKTAANRPPNNLPNNPPYNFVSSPSERSMGSVQLTPYKSNTNPSQHTQSTPFKSHQIITSLLKDTASTDVCFTFPADKIIPNAVICAHRFALMTHKQLYKVLFQEKQDLSLREKRILAVDSKRNGSWCIHGKGCKMPRQTCANSAAEVVADALARFEVSVVNIDKFSLATFCAFLTYIYTGETELCPVTTRFAMFRFSDHCAKKIPLWIDEPMTLSTTWDELLKISIYYGIEDLQARCRQEVIDSVNKLTAIETLFSTSAKDPAVRRIAVATVIENMNTLFKETEDPFSRYKDHPDYHSVMMELMRLRVNGD